MNFDVLCLALYHRRYQRLLIFLSLFSLISFVIWRIQFPDHHYLEIYKKNKDFNYLSNDKSFNSNDDKNTFFDSLANAIDAAKEDKIEKKIMLNVSSIVDTDESKCPFCFGTDFCEDMRNGLLMLESYPQKYFSQKVSLGTYKTVPVAVVIFSDSEAFNLFDRFICQLNSKKSGCSLDNYSEDVLQLFNKQSVQKLKKILKSRDLSSIRHAGNLLCITDGLLEQLQDAMFMAGDISREQYAMFFTALVIQPEVMNLKFMSQEKLDLPFPVMVGTCGRVMIVEYSGEPLEQFLTEPWERRADLALKLISTVNSFLESDDSLLIIFQGFTFEDIYVTSDNRIIIMNTRHMTFVDKNLIDEFELPESDPMCNADCLNSFKSDLFNHSSGMQEKACNKAKVYGGNLMYRDLCQSIFSDLPHHIEMNSFFGYHPGKGLLHSMPKRHFDDLKSALEECVHEKEENDRMHAIEELQEILSIYTSEVHV